MGLLNLPAMLVRRQSTLTIDVDVSSIAGNFSSIAGNVDVQLYSYRRRRRFQHRRHSFRIVGTAWYA
jgi:hypothetical protein